MEKTLIFSEPFLTAEHITYTHNFKINGKAIVINIDLDPLEFDELSLPTFKSVVCANTTIELVKNMLLFTIPEGGYLAKNQSIDREIIETSWQHIYELTNNDRLKSVELWRSEKIKMDHLELNLWFAPKGTQCGIHNMHDFLEVHTQIYGLGRMQKFRTKDPSSIYQEVYMSPGFSNNPFYSNLGLYPWHQYVADTDSIWLAIEQHSE